MRALVAVASLTFLVWVVPADAASRRCGRVSTGGHRAKVKVVKGHVSCDDARTLIADTFKKEAKSPFDGTGKYGIYWKVDGWKCSIGLAGSQTFCRRSGRQVDGSTRHDDGWSF